MKELLSVRSKRILNILNHLLENNKGCLIVDLAKINDCTVQTVYNDVKYVKNNFSAYIKLDYLGNTIRMDYYSVGSLLKVKESFLSETICLNILITIFIDQKCTISSLALLLNFSEVHIRTKIKDINEVLKPFDIRIEITKYQTLVFENSNNLQFSYFIALIMKMTGKSLQSQLSNETLKCIENIVLDYELPPEIHTYLKDIACTYTFKYGDYNDFFKSFNGLLSDSNILSATLICISELESYKNRSLSPQSLEVMKRSANTLIALSQLQPQIIDNFFNRYDIFYKMFKQDNTKFCIKFEEVLDKINANYDINMDKVMSKIIYHLFIHNEEIDLRKSLKVGVYSDLGINHSKILAGRIQERFVEHSVFPITSIDELNYADFICSTILLDDISSQRVTIINDYITPNDLLIINAKTKEIFSSEPK